MNKLTIGRLTHVTLKQFGAIYLAVVGGIWLLLEPLSLFGLFEEEMNNLGLFGYFSLFITSLVMAVLFSQFWRNYNFYSQDFIEVIVESSIEGASYKVKAPKYIQIFEFVGLFVEHLEKGESRDSVRVLRRSFYPILNIVRNREKIDIDQNMRLCDIDLMDDDIFAVCGKPIEVNRAIMFSRLG